RRRSALAARGAPKNPKSCHERALGLLAVRARSRWELERRLLQAGFDRVEVDEVLDRLERVGLVDDATFAREFAEQGFGVRRSGRRAVSSALLSKGVAPSIVADIVAIGAPDEAERAEELACTRASRMGSLE